MSQQEKQQILSPYQAADQRGDLAKLVRLGRTGEKRECAGYGHMYTFRHDHLTIYVDEPKPFMLVIDGDHVVCSSIKELLIPGDWFDRLLDLATIVC